jgi:acetyltransferase-like isoleucine patch superfamily enzyme
MRLRWRLANLALAQNHGVYWPVHPSSVVNNWRNVVIGVETAPGMMPGCYVQGAGGILIGDYTLVAAGVGIVSANHAPGDTRTSLPGRVTIGSYCWLAMNSVVLPGVTLGDFTMVGAGAVVTKSFPDGYVVIAGNPARVIRQLDPRDCRRHRNEHEYHGFVRAADFAEFRRAHLTI